MIEMVILLIFLAVLILDIIRKSEYSLVVGVVSIVLLLTLGAPLYAIAVTLAIPLYNLILFISIESVRRTLRYAEVIFEVLKPLITVLLAVTIGMISRRIIFVYMDQWTSSALFTITFFIALSFALEPSVNRLSYIGKLLTPNLYNLSKYLQNIAILLGIVSLFYSATVLQSLVAIPILMLFVSLYILRKIKGVARRIIVFASPYIIALILSLLGV
ncbi:MAG: hypothetical protein QW775_05425 [Ignisphaera sp.]|uniref:Uncharacterized protein n=1 Tax=Ignisphaera aggregans TaxID=334771 RepID=A0A7C4NTQ7_9CREN